jgi:hypothetical protein
MFPVNHKNDGKSFLDYNTNGFLNVDLLEITIKKNLEVYLQCNILIEFLVEPACPLIYS